MKQDTLAVHCGRTDLKSAHVPPIDLSTTYKTPNLDAATKSIDSMASGKEPTDSPIYQRLHNPTVARFEEAFATMEHASHSVSFSSGMAALTAAFLAAKMSGDHIVAVRPLYGGTDHLLSSGLLGLDVTWATPDNVADAIRENTSLIVCETPANPTVSLLDIEDIVENANGIPVLVDSTFATPILQNPIQYGAAMALHSGTKFIGGHGDIMAGIIACDTVWAQRLRQVRILTGSNLHPMAAYQLHRGLQTLPIRVRCAQENAIELVKRLLRHNGVARVLYPGLPNCDPHNLVGRQMKGPGTMIAIELAGGYPAARRAMSRVELITPAVSLGSCDTLIQHPAGLTHRIVSDEAREIGGISPGLLRISVGIEDVEDLWDDLDHALEMELALSAK
ncbi:MAG: aminotransferase class I/II-fold pyridoxal phosphate-dependent enzyme [Myxococcota bacterium]|nr:aminotransferase class I/II-fold pyridoxal phosphate-dependent enzyme [Myxococcota bacterium]